MPSMLIVGIRPLHSSSTISLNIPYFLFIFYFLKSGFRVCFEILSLDLVALFIPLPFLHLEVVYDVVPVPRLLQDLAEVLHVRLARRVLPARQAELGRLEQRRRRLRVHGVVVAVHLAACGERAGGRQGDQIGVNIM